VKQIIFTDLDGTLLDSITYSYEKSLAGINKLKQRDIPIIFCSAKTRTEQELYRTNMGVFYPFIVENGGAIFIPRSYFPFPFDYHKKVDNLLAIELGSPYKEIRRLLNEVRAKGGFHFRGFGDMSVEEVAQVTGLGIELARLAKQREYSETLVIASPSLPVILREQSDRRISLRVDSAKQSHVTCREIDKALGKIKGVGLNWTHGGRFYDIMGANDKGKAVNILVDLYHQMWGEVTTIGLGDSLNDLPMLSVVDLPILVQKKTGSWEEINLPRLRRVQGVGPEGWSRAIRELIEGCLIQQQSLSSGGKHGA